MSRSARTLLISSSALLLLSATLGAALQPDLKYTTVNRVQLGGMLGKAAGFMARLGGGDGFTETMYLKGDYMRTDDDESSTSMIVDLNADRYVYLDHKRKTYHVLTFDQLRQQLDTALQEAQAGDMNTDAAPQEETAASNTDVKFAFDVNRTGQHERIRGHASERVLMTFTAEATNTAEADSEEQGIDGTMVIAMELWMSKDVPGHDEVQDFHQRMAAHLGEAFMEGGSASRSLAEGLQEAFASDPRMQEGLSQAAEEAAQLEGHAVRSVTHVVLVPPGLDFQEALAFGGTAEAAKQEKADDRKKKLGRFARTLAKQAAGLGGNEAEEPEEAEPRQVTLLTITSELENVETTPLSDDLFAIPDGYRAEDMSR